MTYPRMYANACIRHLAHEYRYVSSELTVAARRLAFRLERLSWTPLNDSVTGYA